MVSCLQSSYVDKASIFSLFFKFEARDFSCFNHEEVFSMVTFSDNKIIFFEIDGGESFRKLHFLALVKLIKKFDVIKEPSFQRSLVKTRFDDDGFEHISIKHVGCALIDGFNGSRSFVVVKEREFTEPGSFMHDFCELYLLVEFLVFWMCVFLIDDNFDVTFS